MSRHTYNGLDNERVGRRLHGPHHGKREQTFSRPPEDTEALQKLQLNLMKELSILDVLLAPMSDSEGGE